MTEQLSLHFMAAYAYKKYTSPVSPKLSSVKCRVALPDSLWELSELQHFIIYEKGLDKGKKTHVH